MDETVLGLIGILSFIFAIYLEFRDIEKRLKVIHEEIKKLKKY